MASDAMIKCEYKTKPRNTTYSRVYSYALDMFDHDKDKCNSWWMSKSEELGGKAPYELVKEGKGRMLIKLINRCR